MSASPQLIALAGVVVGGAITAFAQQLRPNARNVRGAARLLREEFDLTATYGAEVIEAGVWQPNGRALSDDVWSERKSLLAAELGRRDWIAVSDAHDAVEAIRTARPATDEPLSPDGKSELQEALVPLRAGCAVLDSLTGPWPTITQTYRRRRRG
jgi:hypothetical protein